MKITENVKTYEDACAIAGIDPVNSLPYPNPSTGDEKAINAIKKLIVINKVLNEGWVPNWNDDDEYKYYPWFDLETYASQVSPGAGFAFFDYSFDRSGTSVGSRLVFKTRELARYAGEQFLEIYRDFMVIK